MTITEPRRNENTLRAMKEIREYYDDPKLSPHQRVRSVLSHGETFNLLPAYQEAAIAIVEETETAPTSAAALKALGLLKKLPDELRGAVSYPFNPKLKLSLHARNEATHRGVLEIATEIETQIKALEEEGCR